MKDEYAVSDIETIMKRRNCEEYNIFTVREVKGLEFKTVYVVDRDMSENEKYISYTRALANLNVIREMPYFTDQKVSLVVEGDETE